MSHMVYTTADGRYSMAYKGEIPWHQLGQEVKGLATEEEWALAAALDFELNDSKVLFLDDSQQAQVMGDQKVLYRSDTKEALSIVHKSYKVVQPIEVLKFFREQVEAHEMEIETAGSLFGGRKIWALAKINQDILVGDRKREKDIVSPYFLLVTSCDKSLRTMVKRVDIRVVCWNTMDAALGRGGDYATLTHRSEFNAENQDRMKAEIGMIAENIEKEQEVFNHMAETKISTRDALGFFMKVLTPSIDQDNVDLAKLSTRKLQQVFNAYQQSPGSDLYTAKDTLWGAVNAVTHIVDHNPAARSNNARLDNAWFGQGNGQKNRAIDLAAKIIEREEKKNILDEILGTAKDSDVADIDNVIKLFAA